MASTDNTVEIVPTYAATERLAYAKWRTIRWASVALLTAITLLGIVIGPGTTYLSKKQELQLQRERQDHVERMDFITKLMAGESHPNGVERTYYRRDVLKFFAVALRNGPIHEMAQAELARTEAELNLTQELADMRAAQETRRREADEAQNELEAVRTRVTELSADCGAKSKSASEGLAKVVARTNSAAAAGRCPRERIHLTTLPTDGNEPQAKQRCYLSKGNYLGNQWWTADIDKNLQCSCSSYE